MEYPTYWINISSAILGCLGIVFNMRTLFNAYGDKVALEILGLNGARSVIAKYTIWMELVHLLALCIFTWWAIASLQFASIALVEFSIMRGVLVLLLLSDSVLTLNMRREVNVIV